MADKSKNNSKFKSSSILDDINLKTAGLQALNMKH